MKKKTLLSLLALVLGVPASVLLSGAGFLSPQKEATALETRKEIASKLYGKIKIVKAGADYRVRIVKGAADLKVKIVNNFADSPGKWKLVDNLEDYSVEIVPGAEDLTVMFVDDFPGVSPATR